MVTAALARGLLAFICVMEYLDWNTGSGAGVTGTSDECNRWNCPCEGALPRYRSLVKKAVTSSQRDWHRNYHHETIQARDRTRSILNRMASGRLDNENHMQLLEDCLTRRDQFCTGVHLETNCSLNGLPELPAIDSLGRILVASNEGRAGFVRQARHLLSKLAVFVDQARRDEVRTALDSSRSLAEEIERLEEENIYYILCKMHVDFRHNNIPWDAEVARDLVELSCRVLDQAPVDNRNYMIFYTLERLLDHVSTQFRRMARSAPADAPEARHPAIGHGYWQDMLQSMRS